MKYAVKIGGQTYAVEIEDVNRRPIVARVNGHDYEVTPEDGIESIPPAGDVKKTDAAKGSAVSTPAARPAAQVTGGKAVVAPLPGTVTEVLVRPGDRVEPGQILLIIEAMKMKNSIRSARAATIAAVCVTPGQAVAHRQTLIEFTE